MTLALLGGGPFTANDELDRSLLATVGQAPAPRPRVAVLPTADAFEDPAALVAAAMAWAERLGVEAEPLMVLHRQEADDAETAAVIASAGVVYLAGDSSMHLRSTLKETAVLRAIEERLAHGSLVVAVGPSAAALCDPMLDQRGGAFTLGLGLAPNVAVIPESESWTPERLHRTLSLADTPVIELPTGAAAVLGPAGWTLSNGAVAHGTIPLA